MMSPCTWHSLIYLLLICAAACDRTPPQFTLMPADDSGLDFRNDLTETQHNNIMTYEYSYNGGGVAVGDLNGDGRPDVYFSGNTVPNKLFLNRGDMRFEDVTSQTATGGRADWATGVSMADVNGDGWLDIYVCYSGNSPQEGYERPVIRDHPKRANELYINQGCEPGGIPTFLEQARDYGLDAPGTFSTQAYFLDYDLDGDLDMFLLNHANMFYSAFLNTRRLRNLRHPYFGNKLFRNDAVNGGAPTFTDVSEGTGIHGSGLNFGLSAAVSDLNGDRYPDIYVTNDYEEQDFCYINNGDGTFSEVSKKLFGHLSKYGMGSDIADLNNDGLPEILVLDMLPEDNRRQKLLKGPDDYDRYSLAVDSGYHHQYMRNTLQLNRGYASDTLPRFSETGQLAGISNTDWSWAPLAADFDNDGLKDIFVSNGFFRDFNNLDFIKYNADAYQQARASRRSIDYLTLVQNLPSTKIPNYVFRNVDGLHFENKQTAWGMEEPSVSNGAAYADFDGDGDLDIVTNNLGGVAFLYRNNQEQLTQRSFLRIRLEGEGGNSGALGAKVQVVTGRDTLHQEAWFSRGYQSGVEPVLHFGLGSGDSRAHVAVFWPDGAVSRLTDVAPNQVLGIARSGAKTEPVPPPAPNKALLTDVTQTSGIDFIHRENRFVDFKVQRLLHYQVSRLGGKFAKGDVNADGNDDVFFGGGAGQPGVLFTGRDDGTFQHAAVQPWADDSSAEDIDALFFDADGDGDQDLYVVSGGGEFISSAPLYQDRLYVNDGAGNFSRSPNALPAETSSGGVVTAADFDRDGDLDLFVGARIAPGSYGYTPRSLLLRNDSDKEGIRFTDVAGEHDALLAAPGMVTCALFTDIDNDTWPDLLVAGEWMPVRLFENRKGKLVEKEIPGLGNSDGWWCSLVAADVDGDGDTDYLAGNAGTNMQFKATESQPVELYAADFNDDGAVDPLINYYIQDRSYPLATRDELLDQIGSLKKKFIKYEDYADATVAQIATEEQLGRAQKLRAFTMSSAWLENTGDGDLVRHTLPAMAQLSGINGFVYDDLDGDGRKEILGAGNFFPFKPQLGRSDASYGIVLRYENGVVSEPRAKANTWLDGDIRDVDILKFKSGIKRILVSRNNDSAGVYSVTPTPAPAVMARGK